MKQKLLALLLALALLCGLAGCAPDSGSATSPAATGSGAADPSTTAPTVSTPGTVEPNDTAPTVTQPGETNPTTPPPAQTGCTHSDGNSDLTCDQCGISVLVNLDFYAINDLHGRFDDTSDQPGVDELSTYLEALDDETTILLASGDMWQGTAASNLTYGAMITEWMNEMDFVSMTLGNHEFDWGEKYVETNEALADFPFLAINIYERSTNELANYCTPSVLIERSGVQIGIIGAIGDCYSSIAVDQVRDIYFKTGSQLTELVKAESERLRAAGADIIVYSLHDGGTGSLNGYYDTALSDGYVDLVFEGHSHQRYQFDDSYGVYHIQGGAENDGISQASLSYNLVTGDIQVTPAFISNSTYAKEPDHPIVDRLLDKYADVIGVGDTVLGDNEKNRDSNYLRNVVAQLYYMAGVDLWGEEYDITLGGGFLTVRDPYRLAAGQVRYADLYSLFPFDNYLTLCSVKGRNLTSRFLETDNSNYFVYYEELGDIDPNGTYYIIVDTYTSTYAPNKLTEIYRYEQPLYARDLLAAYISDGNLAGKPIPDSYTLTDIPTLLDICEGLGPNGATADSYFVKGTVVSVSNERYGNMTIQDENGNRLYIYGVYSTDGVRYDQMADAPQVGDTVILYGQLKHYVPSSGRPIFEMMEAKLIEKS